MSRSKEEALAYQRGYAAGRKRAGLENDREFVRAERELFRQKVFLTILPELVARPWKTGEKTWTSMQEFVDGAWKFADLAEVRTNFTGLTIASAGETRRAEPVPVSVEDEHATRAAGDAQ